MINALKLCGLIIDDLSKPEKMKYSLYKGVCRLNKHKAIARRIDILFCPENELGAALMHFTGPELFNRRIRLHARNNVKKKKKKQTRIELKISHFYTYLEHVFISAWISFKVYRRMHRF